MGVGDGGLVGQLQHSPTSLHLVVVSLHAPPAAQWTGVAEALHTDIDSSP